MTILDVTETSKQVDYSYERTSGGSHQGAVESEQVREHSDGPSSERGRLRATAVQTEESQARTGARPSLFAACRVSSCGVSLACRRHSRQVALKRQMSSAI